MKFNAVRIKNFKGIADMELELKPGINLILGENGVGKTSVLEAMTIAVGSFFNGINGVGKKGISSSQIRFDTHISGNASTKIEYYSPAVIQSVMDFNQKILTGEISRNDTANRSRTKYSGGEISRYANQLCNDMASVLPLLCYFGTQRMAQPKREDFGVSSKNALNDRRCGYIGCMDDNLDRKALEAWCLKMEMTVFKQNAAVHEYEVFKEIVSNFMKYMNCLADAPGIEFSRRFDEMVYTENGIATPIKYLSAGYQSLLWMIMTMAFRLCQLNPSIADYHSVPGIVLIDEIDMHLHPRWQWKIINALRKTFPAVQFILATHAPIIISSCENANMIQIDEKQAVCYPESAYGFSIDDVAELRQGSTGIPAELKKLAKEFESAFYDGDKTRATMKYREMLQAFGEENTEVDLAKRRLELL